MQELRQHLFLRDGPSACRLTARGDKTEVTVAYTLIFVAPVNYFIRAAIERGAEGGLAKNFAQLVEVLGKRLPVQTAEQAAAAVVAQVRQTLLSRLFCTLTASKFS